jgi:hypothetical protein
MASYEDLFGTNGAATGGSGRWMKWENDGEAFLFQQTEEPVVSDQMTDDKKVKWLVRMVEGGKVKPMGEGEFNPDQVDGAWKPKEKDVTIQGRVLGKKDKDGKKVEPFEPFDAAWELKAGDFLAKLQAEMRDTGHPAAPGTVWALKRLSSETKPYQYSVKIVKPVS